MSLKSNNKPPRSPQQVQQDLDDAVMVEKIVRMVESEEFTVLLDHAINLFRMTHPLSSPHAHLHQHNSTTILAAVNFKQLLIDLPYELKKEGEEASKQKKQSDFIDDEE